MNKLIIALMLAISTNAVADHRHNNAAWFVGGMVVGAAINQASQPRVTRVATQQYIIVQPQVAPREQYLPPAYHNGMPFCPNGMMMHQRVGKYGNLENVGCSY